jgi:Uma2 family endonuclease
MAMPAETARRWTAREVRALIAESPLATPRYELVDGELLVTPSPGAPHQMAVGKLLVALSGYLQHESFAEVISSPSDVELEPEFVAQPDILVVPMPEWRRVLREGLPIRELILAVEVLSPSSSRHDRVRKRPLYQRHVPDYWIVDLDARLVERWAPGDERPEIVTEHLSWHPAGAKAQFTLALPEFFAGVFGTE